MRDQDGENKSLGDMIKEAVAEMGPADPSTYTIEFNDDLSTVGPPWIGPGAGMGHERGRDMPFASDALLEVGDLLPERISPAPEMGPTTMTEEEWLRELARRITKHADRFGLVDKQVRRELELAARMLDSYAHLWELRNRGGDE